MAILVKYICYNNNNNNNNDNNNNNNNNIQLLAVTAEAVKVRAGAITKLKSLD